jgi:hypothetical protein
MYLRSQLSRLRDAFDQISTTLSIAVAVALMITFWILSVINSYTEVGANDVGKVVAVNDVTATRSGLYPMGTHPMNYMTISRSDPQSIVETTTSRFHLDSVWTGVPGEAVTLRQMRSGDMYLCGVVTDCAMILRP